MTPTPSKGKKKTKNATLEQQQKQHSASQEQVDRHDNQKTEKSREEVVAERKAKKAARKVTKSTKHTQGDVGDIQQQQGETKESIVPRQEAGDGGTGKKLLHQVDAKTFENKVSLQVKDKISEKDVATQETDVALVEEISSPAKEIQSATRGIPEMSVVVLKQPEEIQVPGKEVPKQPEEIQILKGEISILPKENWVPGEEVQKQLKEVQVSEKEVCSQQHKISVPKKDLPTKVNDTEADIQQNSREVVKEGRSQKVAKEASRCAKQEEGVLSNEKQLPPQMNITGGKGAQLLHALENAGKTKSRAELKAERRAKQEAQRATKQQQNQQKPDGKKHSGFQAGGTAGLAKQTVRVPDDLQADRPSVEKKLARTLALAKIPLRTKAQRKVLLFSHLHQYEREASLTRDLPVVGGNLHPAIVRLGLQYAEGVMSGSNARCVALLHAMKQVILDYVTPPQKELSRDLDAKIKPYITFIKQCRPLSVSMGNAIRFLKWQINHIPSHTTDSSAKEKLLKAIENYIHENIYLAAEAISITAREKITDGDVILTYACSSLLKKILVDAYRNGKKFRVVVVDGRPRMDGREMLRYLVNHGLKCSYVLLSAASYIMHEVTKVFLGAHGLLANGYVLGHVGSSQVALVAKAYNVPVMVCCEAYKFCERVQTDSFVFNELGDPDDLVQTYSCRTPLADWRDVSELTLLNLRYDVTPPDLVTAVINELAILPCTSVPVVLRVRHTETS